MGKRGKTNIVLCILSLGFGGVIYVVFKENTYVYNAFNSIFDTSFLKNSFGFLNNNIVKNYITDYLWALSLNFGLNSVFLPDEKSVLIAAAVFICGAVLEILQYADVIFGTGDIIDTILYLTAGLTVVLVNKLLLKGEKQ